MFLRYAFALSLTALSAGLSAQNTHETMYVQGGTLYDKCGEPVVLHGINYPVMDDWDFPASSEVSDQIALSGANAVRIQWYIDYGQPGRPAYALKDLDTVISRVARLDMIPIIELHDFTCQSDVSQLAGAIVPWYTQADVLQLIEKHKAYLIIDFANEYGAVNWAGDVGAAQTAFQTAYADAVVAMRNAGINVPLMIDAPDCGTSSNRLVDVASGIHAADPAGNVIFSVHAYWYGYAQNDSLTMRNHLQQMGNSGFCFVLGEVANYQDDGSPCTYALDYPAIMHSAMDFNIGWLVWAWYKDGCAARQITTAGSFANLTPFGQDVIHHSDYGLMHVAQRSPYLLNNGCVGLGVTEPAAEILSVYPNPAGDFIRVTGMSASGEAVYSLTDISGRMVFSEKYVGTDYQISLAGLAPGCYILLQNGRPVTRVLVQR